MGLIARARRRRAGIYLVRTRRHTRWGRGRRRENGYVGRSNYVDLRRHCHLGACRHQNHTMKDWADLDPIWYVLRLPWWLSWKWVQASLERFAIWALLPRYNVQGNGKNPRRVELWKQKNQRAARDRVRATNRMVPVADRDRMGIR